MAQLVAHSATVLLCHRMELCNRESIHARYRIAITGHGIAQRNHFEDFSSCVYQFDRETIIQL